ncbi:MAG: metallophosphatase family protein [Dysgonamonadaceae bacterium]|jgi:putative phosphoesterase|nr:metallophosphatase family protein [Dysgonamonadaceae bacterium]
MRKIGLLSDTHSLWDEKFAQYFASCDEIWHAGDIGSEEVLNNLEELKPVRAVRGNTDGYNICLRCPTTLRFKVEDVDVLLTHIGGYPGNYDPRIRAELAANPPRLFVCGHSHILKVIYDKKLGLLAVNPGAAGLSGFHTVRTLLRFVIDGAEIKDMEVIEMDK